MNPPELDVLDQLQGRDMPLAIMASLFPDMEKAKRSIGAMIRDGEVILLDDAGAIVADWRWAEIEREPDAWLAASEYRLRITDLGAQRA